MFTFERFKNKKVGNNLKYPADSHLTSPAKPIKSF